MNKYKQRPIPETKQEVIDYVKGLVADGFAENSIGELIVNRVPPVHAWSAFEAAQKALEEVHTYEYYCGNDYEEIFKDGI